MTADTDTHAWTLSILDPDNLPAPVAWDALPRISICVARDASVHDALIAAAREARPRLSERWGDKYERGEGDVKFFVAAFADDASRAYGDLDQLRLYGIDEHGELVVGDVFLENITVGDVRRGFDAGYNAGDFSRPILVPAGRGAAVSPHDLQPWIDFFQQAKPFITTIPGVFGAAKAGAKGVDTLRMRRTRAIAKRWVARNLSAPRELRRWIDRKDSWKSKEVADRLKIDTEEAQRLLTALGLEEDRHSHWWRRTDSDQSRRMREDWIEGEQAAGIRAQERAVGGAAVPTADAEPSG